MDEEAEQRSAVDKKRSERKSKRLNLPNKHTRKIHPVDEEAAVAMPLSIADVDDADSFDPTGSMGRARTPSKHTASHPSVLLASPSKVLMQADRDAQTSHGKSWLSSSLQGKYRLFTCHLVVFFKLHYVFRKYIGYQSLQDKNVKALESAVLVLKPEANTPSALYQIQECLESHQVRIVSKGSLPSSESQRLKLLDSHFHHLHMYAELVAPAEIALSSTKKAAFKAAFKELDWDTAVTAGSVFNAQGAVEHLGVTDDVLASMWKGSGSSNRVRLAQGLHVAKFTGRCTDDSQLCAELDRLPIFVVNGFYRALRTQYVQHSSSTSYLVIEWDGAAVSWEQMHSYVIGSSNPSQAIKSSIRGTLYRCWEDLGLAAKPSSEQNCVHVSDSAFQGLIDRLNWSTGTSMLFTDVLGSKLISSGVTALTLQKWLTNSTLGGQHVVDHMRGLNSVQCVAKAKELLGKAKAQGFS